MGGFQESWAEATQHILTGRHLPDIAGFEDGIDVQVTRSSATKGSTDIEELFYSAIAGARERLWVTTAFFVPPDAFADALCASARRGVDVRILAQWAPYRQGSPAPRRTAFLRQVAASAACVSSSTNRTMLHAKTLMVDGAWASVGSNNFTNRSLALNSELSFSVSDRRHRGAARGAFPRRPARRQRVRPGKLAQSPTEKAGYRASDLAGTRSLLVS